MPENNRIFSHNFILVTLVAFGAFLTFQFIMTSIPFYTLSVGGNNWDIGLVAGLLALSSTPARLLAGPWVDRIGRKPILYIGAGLIILSTLLYQVAHNIPVLFIVRLIHGIGFGALHVTTTILITDITPKERWGEAQGYFTALTIISMAVSPPLGFILYERAGFGWVFMVTTIIAAMMAFLILFIPETGKKTANLPSITSIHSIFDRRAILPATILALTTWGHGMVVAFLPVFTRERHILNPGLYFTMLSIVAVVSRGFVGRLSDRYGRGTVLVPGLLSAAAGLLTLHFAANTPMLMMSGLLFGLGFSTVSPIVMVLAAERVDLERRGTAMGMVSASNDLGILAGSFIGGFIIAKTGFSLIFIIAAALIVVGILIFLAAMRHKMSSTFHLR